MAIAQSLGKFQVDVAQCNSLIANAHVAGMPGIAHLTARDREQVTVAAFLNLFIAWEEFIESAMNDYMMGDATVSGNVPTRYVSPITREHSGKMLVHTNKYFDFANQENVKRIANVYFDDGYPFTVPINSLTQELSDLKIIRNACAHMSSTTRVALEGLAIRIFGSPRPNITVYQMLIAIDPRTVPADSVYASYRDKLLAAATIIAQG